LKLDLKVNSLTNLLKTNLTLQTNMNKDKHIWEGWTVGDFINDIEPIFDMCAPFHDKQSLKRWVTQKQPYYKKHIPEVYNYFLQKSGL
jgi:hypothetical protein